MGKFSSPIIGFFETLPGYGGGNTYQRRVMEALQKDFDVRLYRVYPGGGGGKRLKMLRKILQIQRRERNVGCWVRTDLAVTALQFSRPRGVNIGLLYHLDSSQIPHPLLNKVFDYLFWRNLRKCRPRVVISDFWKEYLLNRGFNDVVSIRFGLDPAISEISPEEVSAFRRRHGFDAEIPLVYLGNCQRGKGAIDAYEALRTEHYQFVTSGKPEAKLPVPNLDLGYRDYLTLLKASSVVVAMSLFLEGWNITVHESMLCGTPVVGSGRGGMKELLEAGGQIICESFNELPAAVRRALEHREVLAEKGARFAAKLNLEDFQQKWIDLVNAAISGEDVSSFS